MTTNHLKRLFFLNIALIVLACILIFKTSVISGVESMLFFIVFSGSAASFFIKENTFVRYLKIAIFNSLFFGFLLSLIFMISLFTEDINDGMIEKSLYIHHLIRYFFYFFVVAVPLIAFWNLFGELVGVVLKGLIERLKIAKKSL